MKLKKILKLLFVVFCFNFFQTNFSFAAGGESVGNEALDILQKYEMEKSDGVSNYRLIGVASAAAASDLVCVFLYKVKEWNEDEERKKKAKKLPAKIIEYEAFWEKNGMRNSVTGKDNIINVFRQAKLDPNFCDHFCVHMTRKRRDFFGFYYVSRSRDFSVDLSWYEEAWLLHKMDSFS